MQAIENAGEQFYVTTFDCYWVSGSVLVAGDIWAGLPFAVDDVLRVEVVRSDGTQRSYEFDFSDSCTQVRETAPQDLTTLMLPGVNNITVRLYDACGTSSGNSSLYLTSGTPALGQVESTCATDLWFFSDGFAYLADLFGTDIVGEAVDCVTPLPSGDTVQRTTTGAFFWDRRTNTPSFTPLPVG